MGATENKKSAEWLDPFCKSRMDRLTSCNFELPELVTYEKRDSVCVCVCVLILGDSDLWILFYGTSAQPSDQAQFVSDFERSIWQELWALFWNLYLSDGTSLQWGDKRHDEPEFFWDKGWRSSLGLRLQSHPTAFSVECHGKLKMAGPEGVHRVCSSWLLKNTGIGTASGTVPWVICQNATVRTPCCSPVPDPLFSSSWPTVWPKAASQ